MENKKKAPGRFRRELPLVLMLLPAVILVAVYSYGSMVGTVIAFQKFNPTKGFFGSPWVGFDNFRNLFTMPTIGQVIYNTVFISLCKMIGGIIVPVIFALLLNEVARISVKRTYQTLVYLPHFLSWVILAGIFKDIFSQTGVINTALSALGMEPVGFLSNQQLFPVTMIVTDIWKGFGFGSVIYLAALTGIDQNLYEAAYIDGAGHFQTLFNVILPVCTPTLATVTLFSFVGHWNSWYDGMIYMNTVDKYPLQTYLQTIVINPEAFFRNATNISAELGNFLNLVSARTTNAAQLFLATIPILCVYPFLQKYFTTGLVMGSVKG